MRAKQAGLANNMPEKKSVLKKVAKKAALILVITISATIVLSLTFVSVFEDRVADIVLTQLYKCVTTEVSHDNVSLSLWKSFPKFALDVEGLKVKAKFSEEDLMDVKNLSLQFNILDMLKGHYNLKKVEVKHVDLHLQVYENNTNNWSVFKKDSIKDFSDFSIALSLLVFSDVKVHYTDAVSLTDVSGEIHKLAAKGDFIRDKFDMKLNTQFKVDTVSVDTIFFCENKVLSFKGVVLVDLLNENYSVRHFDFVLDKIRTVIDATLVRENTNVWRYKAEVGGDNVSLFQILSESPFPLDSLMNAYDLDGNIKFKAHVNGFFGDKSDLSLKLGYSVKNGIFLHKTNKMGLKNITMSGVFESSLPDFIKSANIEVKKISGNLKSGWVEGKFIAENLKAPKVKINLKASMMLEDLKEFIPKISSYKMGGSAEINVHFENKFPDLSKFESSSFRNANINGSIRLNDASFQMDTSSLLFDSFKAIMVFSNQTLNIQRFSGKIQGNTCVLSGYLTPVLDFVFSDNARLNVRAAVSSPRINVDSFILKNGENNSSEKHESIHTVPVLPEKIDADIQLKSDVIKYDRLDAKNVKGELVLNNSNLSIKDFSMNALNGKLNVDAIAKSKFNKGYSIDAKAKVKNMDIQRLFYVLHDFGQDQSESGLTHRNIRGSVTADIKFSANTDSNINILPESIDCKADLLIKNGALINYKPAESLSSFVNVQDLKNIKFETLENRIGIHSSVISIPKMNINNNAINLNLSGTHSFDGDMHYNIRIHLNELIAKKRRARVREDFGEVMDDGSKGVYLYLLLGGNVDNPEFKWNKTAAKQGFKENVIAQKQELKDLFSSEKDKDSQKSEKVIEKKGKKIDIYEQKPSEIEVGEDW